jgi:hypothetical protein
MKTMNTARDSNLVALRWAALWAACAGLLFVLTASGASAQEPFIYNSEPVHPGCVHALVMQAGDALPVTTSVSLPGCMASERSKPPIERRDKVLVIRDEALLGDQVFGYRHLSTLDNGIFVLGILRESPDGSNHVTLAAVQIVERPTIRFRELGTHFVLQMVGEVWIKDMQMASVRTVGNKVHFSAGVGPSRETRTVDLSKIGKALAK